MKLKKYITSMLVAGIVLTSTSSAFAMNNNSNNQDSIGVSKLSIQEIDDNKVNLKNSAPVEDKLKSIEEQEKEWKELEERVADLESSIICMECKDHLDSDDYLQLGYLNQELVQCKKDLENGNYEL